MTIDDIDIPDFATMKIGSAGLALIKEFEGCRFGAYQDSVGVWTIGFGHTGPEVVEGLSWRADEIDAALLEDCKEAEACVNSAVMVPLTQNEFDALVAFVFNLGCGNFRKSTLLKKLLDSDFDGAALEFKRWDKAGGKVLAGLTRRRLAEATLFETA